MSATPLDRMERLFRAAQLHPAEERAAFLDAVCGNEETLRRELESLLRADLEAEQGAFLKDTPAFTAGIRDDLETTPGQNAGQNIEGRVVGPYQLLRRLGQGGMGEVYFALRSEPYKRYVALKIIRPGMSSAEVLQRFEMERQILASLDHPNIAQLLDGGVTDDGRPYLVMEYVDGKPITKYCDEKRFDLSARLALFQTVCQAVQHAHQNLVLHRDLKPSNILVTEQGVVKLLDFGIAKILNPHLSPITMPVTRTQMRLMTPEYASPEQVRGDTMTTSSDVYSLGVILYELLSGHRPYRLYRKTTAEIEQVVCELHPDRPSTRVGKTETLETGAETKREITPAAVSEARSLSVGRLQRTLKGDLDNVVMMALRKEPERRYRSVEQFQQDIKGYLEGQPVIAHRDSRRYRAAKFISRHRIETLAASIITVLLVGFSFYALNQARTLAEERDQKDQEAQKAQQVTAFVLSLFESANPLNTPSADTVSVRHVLEIGAARIQEELADQPAVRADMLGVIAGAYQNLGRTDLAIELTREQYGLLRALNGAGDIDALNSLEFLIGMEGMMHRSDSAETHARMYLDALLAMDDPDPLKVWTGSYHLYINSHQLISRQESDSLFAFWRSIEADLPKTDDFDLAISFLDMGDVLNIKNDLEEAERLYKKAIEMQTRLLGNDHQAVGFAKNRLSELYIKQGNFQAALEQAQEALAINKAIYEQEGHETLAASLSFVGRAIAGLGNPGEGESYLLEALDVYRKIFDNDNLLLARTYRDLGRMMHLAGWYDKGVVYFEESINRYRQIFGSEFLITIQHEAYLAELLRDKGDFERAEALLQRGYDVLRTNRGEDDRYTKEAAAALQKLYEAWGNKSEARQYGAVADGD